MSKYLPLEEVTRPTVPTGEAAFYLNRKSQTLRMWAFRDCGAMRPVRISGRLAWSVAEIRKLLAGGA
ncbi:MAG: DNA-binding protein [Nitrosomonas sp.]|nr:DNA-binding protein [Nitrosomonas sp.]MDP1951263.1 DNA-binding protein [Nitrosomonas sp.]